MKTSEKREKRETGRQGRGPRTTSRECEIVDNYLLSKNTMAARWTGAQTQRQLPNRTTQRKVEWLYVSVSLTAPLSSHMGRFQPPLQSQRSSWILKRVWLVLLFTTSNGKAWTFWWLFFLVNTLTRHVTIVHKSPHIDGDMTSLCVHYSISHT